jgi:hypothetical protein
MQELMNMDIAIVCHTEFGFVKNKKIIFNKSANKGVTNGVENLTKLADKYGAKITFAVCPEVVQYFPESKHEIGLHIHPGCKEFSIGENSFFVGDSFLWKQCTQSNNSTVLVNHSFKEQLSLIKTGKDYINESFGVEVSSFVSGRWSINNETIKALLKAGITHECSSQPSHKTSYYDWSQQPRLQQPYRPSIVNYQEKGNSKIIILPISQTLLYGNVNPEIIPLVGSKWLLACFLEYYHNKMPFFQICLHSPIMTDSFFINQMDKLLNFISKFNVSFKFASEIDQCDKHQIPLNTKKLYYINAINQKIIKDLSQSLIKKFIRK